MISYSIQDDADTHHSTKTMSSSSSIKRMAVEAASAPAARTFPSRVYQRTDGILKSPFSCPGNLNVSSQFGSARHRTQLGRTEYRVTHWIFGTSPGSKIAYAMPLNVVPTSIASTSLRRAPLKGGGEGILG